jgi:hypothetical protein
MNTVLAKIDEAFLNTVLAKISVAGEKNWSGKIDLPGIPDKYDPKWSVTVKFTITSIRGMLENDRLKVFAKVHVQAGPISYTDEVEAEAQIGIDGTQVFLRIKSLIVSVYVAPLGGRIELGNFDVCGLLPNPIEARFKVLPDPYTTSLPDYLGGGQVAIRVSNPQVAVHPGGIEASATVGVS